MGRALCSQNWTRNKSPLHSKSALDPEVDNRIHEAIPGPPIKLPKMKLPWVPRMPIKLSINGKTGDGATPELLQINGAETSQ
jgi:hypothetical protein